MKKRYILFLLLFLVGMLFGCNAQKEAEIVRTFEESSAEQKKELWENGEAAIMETYYEMSDGTWRTEEHSYQYRLEITGRLHEAAKDSTYVILSNIEEITFEQAWKASGLSSNTEDYFSEEEAVFVEYK